MFKFRSYITKSLSLNTINSSYFRCDTIAANKNILRSLNTKTSIKKTEVLDHNTIRVIFDNDKYCDFKNIWLRDSCACEKCLDKITRHKLFEIPYTNIKFKVKSSAIDPKDRSLNIEWTNSKEVHHSRYLSDWLYQFIPLFTKNQHVHVQDPQYSGPLVGPTLWDKEKIEKENLNVRYEDFMKTNEGLLSVLENVYKYGISLIKGVPAQQNEVVKVVERMGHLQETGYGKTFQVKINPHPKTHLTYTGKRFEFHTDLSYMRNSPTMQLLHCIKAQFLDSKENSGGISFFADSFEAIAWLRNHHPSHFETLSKTKVTISYLDAQRNRWFRHHRSIIALNAFDEVTEFFCSDFGMRPPLLALDKIVPFYEAYHCLMEKVNTDKSMWKFFLQSGDLVVFNNTRVLHGRDEYDPSKIERHLEGAYMDLQEVFSLYENMMDSK